MGPLAALRDLCAEPCPQACNLKLDTFLGRLGKGRGQQQTQPPPPSQGKHLLPFSCFTINLAPPGFAQRLCATILPVQLGQEPPYPHCSCSALPEKKEDG